MSVKLKKGILVKFQGSELRGPAMAKVVDAKHSNNTVKVEIVEGEHKGDITIVDREHLIIKGELAYEITEKKRSKRELLKQIKSEINSLYDTELKITNYHQEDNGDYCNDIEVQIWQSNEYVATVIYKSYEIKSFNHGDWFNIVDYIDIICFKEKEEIFKYIKDKFMYYEDFEVVIEESYS